MKQPEDSVFERHPRAALAVFFLAFLMLFAIGAEVALNSFTGLGRPVLFYENPVYGYRMKPNQETWRFGGAHFKINNLGLRANEDWDDDIRGKVLFVGDSVTYGGNHISNEDLFSTLAVKGLPLKAGNAGIPNWGVENVYGLVVEEQFAPAATVVLDEGGDDGGDGLPRGQRVLQLHRLRQRGAQLRFQLREPPGRGAEVAAHLDGVSAAAVFIAAGRLLAFG